MKGGYALEVTGGTAYVDTSWGTNGYVLDQETGELSRYYRVTPDGSGPVTVKSVVSTEKAPDVLKIQYVDPYDAIDKNATYTGNFYVLPGGGFRVFVKYGYSISVAGSVSCELMSDGMYGPDGRDDWKDYDVEVDENAAAVTVTSVKLAADATLKVSGDAGALLAKDPDGEAYCVDGDELPGGHGFVLVRSGYAITGVQGGKVQYRSYVSDGGPISKDEIYTVYYVEAAENTVTLTVSPSAPNHWVTVHLVNYFEDEVDMYPYAGEFWGNDGISYAAFIPAEGGAAFSFGLSRMHSGVDLADYSLHVQGGSVIDTWSYESAGRNVYYEIALDDVDEVTITLVKDDMQPELEVKVPDEPAAGVPGVPDKAATEKKLMDTASAVVDAALRGETPAGVSRADAAAIAQAAADGKTITTQLEVKAVTAPADAAALKTDAGEDVITRYVDIQIVVLADGEQIGRITETDEALSFAVVLSDEELAKGGIFYVIRSHDGKTSALDAWLDGNELHFSSDKFSTFAVANSNDISLAEVEAIAGQTWTGSEVKPAVKVTANGSRTLTEGVDYTVSYKNNVDTGTATVVITGIGAYSGTKEVTFQIAAPAPTATPAPTAKPAGTTKPAADIPATGDETPLALYAGLLAMSLAGLVLVLGRKKRTEK